MLPSSSPLLSEGSSISTLLLTPGKVLPPWAIGSHGWHAFEGGKRPYYEVNARTEQGILFGTTEIGLSTTLHRLAFNAAHVGWKVFLLDAQGSQTKAATFYATMQEAGQSRVRVFPHMPYAGWSGTPDAILHRLLQLSPSREPYYQHIAIAALSSVLLEDAPSLQCSQDLVRRLTGLLENRSRYNNPPLIRLLHSLRRVDLPGPSLRYAALSALAGNSLNGTWSYDETDAAYFSFNAWSRPDEARMQARFLLADLASYLVERTQKKTPVLLLINHPEHLFDPDRIPSLFAHMQAAHGSLFLATSSPANFGRAAHPIMSNASVLLIHRSLSARPFVPYLALPWWKRNPLHNAALQALPDSECFALGNGQVTQVQVAPVPIDASRILHATKSLSSRPQSPDPFEIFTIPEEEGEGWQPFFTPFDPTPPPTDKTEMSQQPLPDAPTRSRAHTRTRRTSKGAVQPEDSSSPEKIAKESTTPKRKPVIL